MEYILIVSFIILLVVPFVYRVIRQSLGKKDGRSRKDKADSESYRSSAKGAAGDPDSIGNEVGITSDEIEILRKKLRAGESIIFPLPKQNAGEDDPDENRVERTVADGPQIPEAMAGKPRFRDQGWTGASKSPRSGTRSWVGGYGGGSYLSRGGIGSTRKAILQIEKFPPLKRAILWSEILGPPKGIDWWPNER